MENPSQLVDGQTVEAPPGLPVLNPANGEPIAVAPECPPELLDRAMAAAGRAFPDWSRSVDRRRSALKEAGQAFAAAAAELAALTTAEQGKPLREAKIEMRLAQQILDYHTSLEIPRTTIQDDATAHVQILRRPLGVVAAITPWNFPILSAVGKLAPALLAGNTVVLKPSPFTPLATLRLGAVLADVFPPGVVNIVSGGDDLGALMTAHPTPRKISFTGSVATGRRVAAAAAPGLKRMTLELGGNDPAILLDDVDPAAVVQSVFWSAFANCGQVCAGIKRVYVPGRLYDDVVAGLAAIAAAIPVGDGADRTTQLGPLCTAPQLARVTDLVRQSVAGGARVAAGGTPLDGPGYFHSPTILADVNDGDPLVDEEQFGPALPVVRYDDLEDALARANQSPYGLGGSVWSADPERAAGVATRLECGTAWVNAHTAVSPAQPFAGAKDSGVGVEGGVWGIEAMTDPQVLYRARVS